MEEYVPGSGLNNGPEVLLCRSSRARSNSLAAFGSKWIFQLVQLAIATSCMFRASRNLLTVAKAGLFVADYVRLSVLEVQDGRLPPTGAAIAEFGLLRDGCRFAGVGAGGAGPSGGSNLSAAVWRTGGGGARLAANGYYFVLRGQGPSDSDPVRWLVEASADDGVTWEAVGASNWKVRLDGTTEYYPDLPLRMPRSSLPDLPGASAKVVEIDSRLSMAWLLTNPITHLGTGALLFCCATAGALGRVDLHVTLFKVIYLVGSCLFTSAAAMAGRWMWREAAVIWLRAAHRVLCALALWVFDASLLSVLTFTGVCEISISAVTDAVLYQIQGRLLLRAVLACTPAVGGALLFALGMFALRHGVMAHASRIMLEDRRRYDAMWALQCSDPKAVAEIRALDDVCHTLSRSSGTGSNGLVRQMQRGDNGASESVPVPVASLDQLFAQARCLEPIFCWKVRAWAEASRGLFPIVGCLGFSRHSEAGGEIKWAQVKSVHRAIEKAVRVYRQVNLGVVYGSSSCCQDRIVAILHTPVHTPSLGVCKLASCCACTKYTAHYCARALKCNQSVNSSSFLSSFFAQ